MGFRMRKSINLGGGFKINLSKSGVGYSWGVPGFRVTKKSTGGTRQTYSIPGTGLSYVKESGAGRSRTGGSASNSRVLPQPNQRHNQEMVLDSAESAAFNGARINNITSAIEKTILLNKWGTILIVLGLITIPLLFGVPLLAGIILKIVASSGAVHLDYSFDLEKQEEFNRRMGAWQLLMECEKMWQVLAEYGVHSSKANAGASQQLDRVICRIAKGTPNCFKTNVNATQLVLSKETLIFLPDKVFVLRKGKVRLIDHDDIRIVVSTQRFIESQAVPRDALVVDQTWRYVNKNGSPDRRYRDNYPIPICQYGIVDLTSNSGLNVRLQFSNLNKTNDFEELIR